MSLNAGTKLGPYEILAPLGAGGMGEVYEARDGRLDRRVAIKVLPAAVTHDSVAIERFEREARAASALNHPNIVTIHEIGEQDAQRFIVMELIDGRSLRALARERSGSEVAWRAGEQIARALSVAHQAGIVHRDIKPENIMMREDGYIKVLDFGVARLTRMPAAYSRADTPGLTAADQVLGTVQYMSPEQARGETVGTETDVFSLGIVLYELATGRHPFASDSPFGFLHNITTTAPVRPAQVNPAIPSVLDTLLLRMLGKDARLRPPAVEVAETLSQFLRIDRHTPAGLPRFRVSGHVVGREGERQELEAAFEQAAAGHIVIACVTGEPGIGKTTLTEEFLAELAAAGKDLMIARGRCSERLAGTEAYLPFLEALDALLHGEAAETAARLMRFLAPTWYAQIASSTGGVAADAKASSQERMKREIAAFFQEVSRSRPLVLVFDDVHWADVSTVDLLVYLAAKLDSMRLLVVATYRPSDLLLSRHPFLSVKLDWQARGLCREIALSLLSREAVDQYLRLEFPHHLFPAAFSRLIHAKTEGSPLFLVDLLRYLRDRKVIAHEGESWILAQQIPELERELPQSIRSMIQRKLDQLAEADHRLLATASVQGYEFDSTVVAGAQGSDPAEVEERLDILDRVHGLVRQVEEHEFPDGTLALRYRFVHVLYQNALYASLMPARRALLSAAVAQALVKHHGEHGADAASELAFLFEGARDFGRAMENFTIAAENAARVFADQETALLARRGLDALRRLPETPERARQELVLQTILGVALRAIRGFGAAEVGEAFSRARHLCHLLGEEPRLVPILRGLWEFHELTADYPAALDLARELLALAERLQDTSVLLVAHDALGDTLVWLGDFRTAREQLERGVALYDRHQHRDHVYLYGYDSGVACLCFLATALWHLGYPDQAVARSEQSLTLARELNQPQTVALSLCFSGWVHDLRGEHEVALERLDQGVAISDEQGFAFLGAWADTMRGSALAALGRAEGIQQIRVGMAAQRRTGVELGMSSYLGALAGAVMKSAQAEASAILEEAQRATSTGELFYLAELHRLRGELLLLQGDPAGAELCFRQAMEVARGQGAKSWELRAAISLTRLLRMQGKQEEATDSLAGIYAWFTEGLQTADSKQARSLLAPAS